MGRMRVLVVRETSPRRPALEVAVSHALVERVNEGALGPVLRLYRPAPTLAFGRLDALPPGFAAAAAAAREHGFEPVVRAPGGHAVAYHDGCLVIDELIPAADPIAGLQERFAQSGEVLAEALRSSASTRASAASRRVLPRRLHRQRARRREARRHRAARRAARVAARRVGGGADGDALRDVLADVYRPLELDWDPATAGGVADEVAGVTVDDVEQAVLALRGREVTKASPHSETLARAQDLEPAPHRG